MFNFIKCFSLRKLLIYTVSILCLAITVISIRTFSNSNFSNSHLVNETSETTPDQATENTEDIAPQKKYIKWVEFSIPHTVLKKVIELDINSQKDEIKLNHIEMLSYISSKIGGNYKNYKEKILTDLVAKLKSGLKMSELSESLKLYNFYLEAYGAVLDGYVGEYEAEVKAKDGTISTVLYYGMKVKHPVKGSYTESDDFGNARNYGFKRKHQGHDFMSPVGTTVCALEEGIVEVMGWNQYGGWRIGIRSLDGKRYYYYAHLRKNTPFAKDLAEGQTVKAGQNIGYVGMTGYSVKENVNNLQTPHLHFGIQLIFDESQKDGVNQIWIDCYQISKLLKNPPKSIILEEKPNLTLTN